MCTNATGWHLEACNQNRMLKPEQPTNSTAAIVISSCFISLQLSILFSSFRLVCGGGRWFVASPSRPLTFIQGCEVIAMSTLVIGFGSFRGSIRRPPHVKVWPPYQDRGARNCRHLRGCQANGCHLVVFSCDGVSKAMRVVCNARHWAYATSPDYNDYFSSRRTITVDLFLLCGICQY